MSNYRRITFISMLFLCLHVNAVDELFGGGSRIRSMGGIGVSIPDNWSQDYNQAGLAYLSNISVSAYYFNRFNLKETGYSALSFVLPVKPGTFALSASNFGYNMYHEAKISLAFAKKLGKHFSAGIQVNYLNTFISDVYDNNHALYAEIGLISAPLKNLRIGFHVINPIETPYLNNFSEELESIVRAGFSYEISKTILIGLQIDKGLKSEMETKVGIEFELNRYFIARSGINLKTIEYSFGIGILFNSLQCDLGFSNHMVLGYSPHISLSYVF